MKKIIFLLVSICFFTSPARAEQWLTFDAQGHPKARGLWVTVRYPASWEAEEGNRPHIVQKFSYYDRNTGLTKMLTLLINDLPPGGGAELNAQSESEWLEFGRDMYSQMSGSVEIKSLTKIIHEGQNGITGQIEYTGERAGDKSYAGRREMLLVYKDKIIELMCMTIGDVSAKDKVSAELQKDAGGLCALYLNSLILMDRY